MNRMWINQPSTHHFLNNLHGEKVLGIRKGNLCRIYFTRGDIISMLVPANILSAGWTRT